MINKTLKNNKSFSFQLMLKRISMIREATLKIEKRKKRLNKLMINHRSKLYRSILVIHLKHSNLRRKRLKIWLNSSRTIFKHKYWKLLEKSVLMGSVMDQHYLTKVHQYLSINHNSRSLNRVWMILTSSKQLITLLIMMLFALNKSNKRKERILIRRIKSKSKLLISYRV